MADEIVKKRTRPDRKEAMSVHTEPGDNRKYLEHSMVMLDWSDVNVREPEQVKERMGMYFALCAQDDMKPSVAGMALAFGVDRKTIWAWANGVDSKTLPAESRNLIKKAYQLLNAQMESYTLCFRNGRLSMKTLNRNKSPFWYLLYDRKVSAKDEYGNETGEEIVFYKPAVAMSANISAATGSAQVEQFGNFAGYDKVIVTDDLSCPIDENTVLFIDKEPQYDEDGKPLYDYVVRRVAKSLNSISYAVSKVTVS